MAKLEPEDLIVFKFDIAEVIGVDIDNQVVVVYHNSDGRSYEMVFKPEQYCDLVKIETIENLEE